MTVDGRRELNRRRTRGAVITETVRLVGENGFEAVTLEMIAEAAGISVRTFSNYFASKGEAFFASEPEPAEAIRAAFACHDLAAPLRSTLRGVLGQLAAGVSERAEILAIRIAAIRADPRLIPAFRARFASIEEAFTLEIAARLSPDGDPARPRLLAGVMVSVLRGSLEDWRSGDAAADLPALVTDSFDVLLATLADLA